MPRSSRGSRGRTGGREKPPSLRGWNRRARPSPSGESPSQFSDVRSAGGAAPAPVDLCPPTGLAHKRKGPDASGDDQKRDTARVGDATLASVVSQGDDLDSGNPRKRVKVDHGSAMSESKAASENVMRDEDALIASPDIDSSGSGSGFGSSSAGAVHTSAVQGRSEHGDNRVTFCDLQQAACEQAVATVRETRHALSVAIDQDKPPHVIAGLQKALENALKSLEVILSTGLQWEKERTKQVSAQAQAATAQAQAEKERAEQARLNASKNNDSESTPMPITGCVCTCFDNDLCQVYGTAACLLLLALCMALPPAYCYWL